MALKLPSSMQSYWQEQTPISSFPTLHNDIECDVVVVGGGIAGLTTAYLLQQGGKSVAVLEKNTIASGTTGGTTGKVTVQHGLIYSELKKHFSKKITQQYADLAKQAFRDIEQLIKKERLTCDWEKRDNFIYTTRRTQVERFKEEAATAATFGLPASFTITTELPFTVRGAVRFKNQAVMNAAQYTRGLAELIRERGGVVYEHSEARHIQENHHKGVVKTKQGQVAAKQIVIATKIPPGPLLARVTYAAIEYPETSYLIAGPASQQLKHMYISPDSNHHSLLTTPGPKPLLFVGGGKHIPGLGREKKHFKQLALYGERWFDLHEVRFKWKAMDYIAYDYLPVAGPLYDSSKRTFVISGFKKWGLNLSMVAAKIISDWILDGNKNHIFSPHRSGATRAIPKAMLNYLK